EREAVQEALGASDGDVAFPGAEVAAARGADDVDVGNANTCIRGAVWGEGGGERVTLARGAVVQVQRHVPASTRRGRARVIASSAGQGDVAAVRNTIRVAHGDGEVEPDGLPGDHVGDRNEY